MNEDEAREWVSERFDDAAVDRLTKLASIVIAENARQNLVAPSTLDSIWSRHIGDSLQLVRFAGVGAWLDIGTGAGFPGLAIAAAEPDRAMLLVEPRRLRADYLRTAAEALELPRVRVVTAKVENVRERAATISARAVAKIATLFDAAEHCAENGTVWVLPKGRSAADEVAEAGRMWHGVFHVEHSITSPDSAIVVAHALRRRR
ncbi:16S rRNA (guanine(527)-N(7))-methyltransferase RsmG [Sphingomonas sp.]|uniref:16S rRNA (guanine(527)-N(7))-methyltransferase RsmG n=1 Tax=Sphingomonas sp. TaxID=28214 RepID=UPI002E30B812|nr:16S rRNA (guanine(527)-N(7))-methyltransferase RsmG [Sphingomonas sp.]HEX4695363.1 16S rRNA (guanine(527)-N(7))-methyltransferase RsmG [Sphingomonas sp.]